MNQGKEKTWMIWEYEIDEKVGKYKVRCSMFRGNLHDLGVKGHFCLGLK